MLLVIPSIKMKHGKSLNVIKGIEGTDNMYNQLSENPVELCKLIRTENVKSLMIIDCDSFEGENNAKTINSICEIANNIDIPLGVYSNFKHTDECRFLLENGVYRILLHDLLYLDFSGVNELISKYTNSMIVFMPIIRNDQVYFEQIPQSVEIEKYINKVKLVGGARIIYQDIELHKNNLASIKNHLDILSEQFQIKFTLFGGVETPNQLWEVNTESSKSIDSLIIDKPFYDNNFPCQEIWRLAEKEEFAEKS